MKWRVMLELVGPDGIVCVHEVCGRAAQNGPIALLAVLGGSPPARVILSRA